MQRGFLRIRDDLTSELDLVHPLRHHADPKVGRLGNMPVFIMLISSRPEYATLQTWSSPRRDSEVCKLVPLVIRALRKIRLLKQVSSIHLHTAHVEKQDVLVCAGQEFVSQYYD